MRQLTHCPRRHTNLIGHAFNMLDRATDRPAPASSHPARSARRACRITSVLRNLLHGETHFMNGGGNHVSHFLLTARTLTGKFSPLPSPPAPRQTLAGGQYFADHPALAIEETIEIRERGRPVHRHGWNSNSVGHHRRYQSLPAPLFDESAAPDLAPATPPMRHHQRHGQTDTAAHQVFRGFGLRLALHQGPAQITQRQAEGDVFISLKLLLIAVSSGPRTAPHWRQSARSRCVCQTLPDAPESNRRNAPDRPCRAHQS